MVQERRVAARGYEFDVTSGGPADGPVVLLLHGFPQNRHQWDLVTLRLHAAGLRTVAVDQRGYSPGARPAEVAAYRLDETAADAVAVLDALGVERAHLVGHDWGALVGWHVAACHPERVATLTAVSVPHPVALAAALREDPDQRRRSAYVVMLRRRWVAETVLRARGGARLRRALRGVPAERVERFVAPMRERAALTGALNWYRALDSAAQAEVGPVAVPTTYVWSDGDVAIGRTAALACGAWVTGDYRFVTLPGVSHWVADEAPEPLAAAILARVGTAP